MRKCIAAAAIAILAACTEKGIPDQASSQDYTAEDVFLISIGGSAFSETETNYLRDGDTLVAYPYPNASAPSAIVSLDSSAVVLDEIGRNMFITECRFPGETYLDLSVCGIGKRYPVQFSRDILYDITYDASSDRMHLRFRPGEKEDSLSPEVFDREDIRVHVTVRWSYTVGYSYSRLIRRFPLTEITEGTFALTEDICLGMLREQYYRVKQLFDEEYEREVASDPKHNWEAYSKIGCTINIRHPHRGLLMERMTGDMSIERYLGDVDTEIETETVPEIFR